MATAGHPILKDVTVVVILPFWSLYAHGDHGVHHLNLAVQCTRNKGGLELGGCTDARNESKQIAALALHPTTYLERTVEPNQLKQSGGTRAQATFQARVAGRIVITPTLHDLLM